MDELRRFDDFAQGYGLALVVRNFDADGGFAGDALDEDRFGLQSEAQILSEADNAAVLDACFRLEFEGGNDRARVDLTDAALYVELHALCFNCTRAVLQLFLIKFVAALAFAEQ